MPDKELSERNLHLLTTLVERFIRDGVPVGSKTLAQDAAVSLSSASIRNIMAELEDAGYLASPHTSAGRVPTDRGYRLFVDSMVTTDVRTAQGLQHKIQGELHGGLPPAQLAESASALLSDITRQAGLVLLPRSASLHFRQVEFLPLSSKRILAILVLNEQEVQNRVINTEQDYSEEQLQRAAAFVNEHYAGREVNEVRELLLGSMREDKSVIDQLMQDAIDFASRALESVEPPSADYVIAGQANLLGSQMGQFEDMQRLRDLFEAFQQKKEILHLMERCAHGHGIQVFIGEESGYDVLDDFSVITAPYTAAGEPVGVLGVIGPTRMAYEKVVPMVDITAKLLTAALKG
ncbi:MAG: heat-inducible transcription repressor HrcA [Pseudomonadales bacterium]|nr:heat-inducible transcriptional repressor HrcA [Gammaproteobacteria bacterium]NNL56194.1 heat-inducible transcription repressor HrcA [Pseudomonadales bacterium]